MNDGAQRPREGVVPRNADLSPKESDIVQLVCKGLSNSEIANIVGLKERTVKWYLGRLFNRFEVTNRTELVGCLLGGGIETSGDIMPKAKVDPPVRTDS
jgi:DNA-binding CsgD family transcriptional regulator